MLIGLICAWYVKATVPVAGLASRGLDMLPRLSMFPKAGRLVFVRAATLQGFRNTWSRSRPKGFGRRSWPRASAAPTQRVGTGTSTRTRRQSLSTRQPHNHAAIRKTPHTTQLAGLATKPPSWLRCEEMLVLDAVRHRPPARVISLLAWSDRHRGSPTSQWPALCRASGEACAGGGEGVVIWRLGIGNCDWGSEREAAPDGKRGRSPAAWMVRLSTWYGGFPWD